MIITVDDLRKQVSCDMITDDLITAKLEAIEAVIRAYTNNNFQSFIIFCFIFMFFYNMFWYKHSIF
mgnify:CR=1 FL=1